MKTIVLLWIFTASLFPACNNERLTSQVESSEPISDTLSEDQDASDEQVLENSVTTPISVANQKWVLIGFEKDGKEEPITYLKNRVSISLKDDPFPHKNNHYWCEFHSGSICYNYPNCFFYSYSGNTFFFNTARFNRDKKEKEHQQTSDYCEIAPKVMCDGRQQPQAERDLMRRHAKALYNDAKSVEIVEEKVYLISKSGSKETIVYKQLVKGK